MFHRGIDFTSDPVRSVTQLAEIGVTRVLTSGGASDALTGAARIAEMRATVGDSLQILPGGGIRAENVRLVLERTGCDQIHLGAALPAEDGSLAAAGAVKMIDPRCADGVHYRRVDAESLQRTIAAARRQ